MDSDASVIIHENVEDFPISNVEAAFGATHTIFRLMTSTDCVGFGDQCRRRRVFDLMFSKKRVKLAWVPGAHAIACNGIS